MTAERLRGPDFLGLGAQRSGTTWAYEHLRRHPQVRFPAGKEVNFWSIGMRLGYPVDMYLQRIGDRRPDLRLGDISPSYATMRPAEIAVVRRHLPDVRLFYLIRNPIERAWSAALMAMSGLALQPYEVSDAWLVDVLSSDVWRRTGDHLACIRSWLEQFPEKQLHLAWYDDLRERPAEVLAGLCRHLGLPEGPAVSLPEPELRQRVHASRGPRLPAHLRGLLVELHRRPIRELAAALGRNLDHWLEPC